MNMQPSVMMAFACESVTIEPGSPTSFNNILDGIEAADFPAPTGRWFAVFCFYRQAEGGIGNCRVVVTHDSGEVVAQTAVKSLTFTANNPISRNVVNFQGLAWPYPGWYAISFVAERDSVLAAFPMLVQLAASAATQEDEEAE